MPHDPEIAAVSAEYKGAAADAEAARRRAAVGTDAETLSDVIWLWRYTTVNSQVQIPSHEGLMRERYGDDWEQEQ